MSIASIIFFSVAIAFVVVKVFSHKLPKKIRIKPFTCMMCMSGWSAFVLALYSGYGFESLLFLPAGMFAGAMTEAVMMRYL